ncbi:MAG: hypothetical protein IPH44_24160 [Myxococcales bacterium]|nr:hypothetical protein [Myxococcales bacterium]MBK7193315.1 hypothetical protein [Myxococcales bacterium]MBP7550716.1 hypothetical protein [Gemmatimonadaceae bacterium]
MWLHRREPDVDAVSAATPDATWHLTTSTTATTTATLYVEVNQSFDWNDYYSKSRFPDDAIYSGSGQVGQPSVVYAATIDLARPGAYTALNPVGHGHHSGRDGAIVPDLAPLTTALEIVDRIVVKVVEAEG